MSAATMPANNQYDSAAELEQICRDAETQEAAHDEALRRRPNANPSTVARQVSMTWQRLADARRPTATAITVAINKVLFEMPPIIDRHVEALMLETTADAPYSTAAAAEILVRWHRDILRYCSETGTFFWWDGCRWKKDASGKKILDLVDHFLKLLGQAALQEYGGKEGAGLQRRISGGGARNEVKTIASAKSEIQVNAVDFDADDWAFNTPAGIVDLRTGLKRDHDPGELCTKMTSATPMSRDEFEVMFASSRFARFLQEIFSDVEEGERKELIDFIQQSLGYCLTGDASLHVVIIFFGEGRNGKNTLIDLAAWTMGDYSKKISNRVLMQKKHEAHPTEIADFLGVRLAVSSEVSANDYFNEALIKELSGDDVLSARFMRQDYFTFRRTQKHVLLGNSKPRLRIIDAAIRSRLKIVPFGVNFEAIGRLDPQLKYELQREGPLVLRWLIEGAARLYRNGMKLPPCRIVERQTAEYMDENDILRSWVAERCLPNADRRTRASALYKDYREWRIARGEQPESNPRWRQAVLRLPGIRSATKDGYPLIVGLELNPHRDDGDGF